MQSPPDTNRDQQLREKCLRNGVLTSREGTGHSTDRKTSLSRQTTLGRRLSTETIKTFSNRKSFRDIVLKAAEHKPFLERLDTRSRNRLAGLGHQARLEKFRQIATRWKNKATTDIQTLPEEDYEEEMPEKPRFCATLSTEAQYAIFKGYEDVLIDRISSSLPCSENTARIKRTPSALPKPNRNSNKSTLPILENQPKIVMVSSGKPLVADNVSRLNPRENVTFARLKRVQDQRYMSTHFNQAMNILDEIKRQSSTEHTPNPEGNIINAQSNIYRQYHAWSKRWAKHFEFSC